MINKLCSAKKNGYSYTRCETLEKSLELSCGNRKIKGLISSEVVNIETMEELGIKISVSSGDYIKPRMLANFCPFCGGRLHDQFDFTEAENK